MPVMSPFTSAMKTGTPALEKPSAMTLSVTVLPVPDAPAMRPWRLAWSSSRLTGLLSGSAPTPIQMALSLSVGPPCAALTGECPQLSIAAEKNARLQRRIDIGVRRPRERWSFSAAYSRPPERASYESSRVQI